ncbi:MAG: hypothetical protein KGY38_06640 [Desulfobacterales bacterium]|nr:hypothetical protein [Desulfobacterales bacterium]MBS3809811.1 hypothetical protein [Desulfobacterales bacterium]
MKTISILTTFVVFLLMFLLTLGMAQDNNNKLDRLEPLERIFEISPGFNRDHMEALGKMVLIAPDPSQEWGKKIL